jgi:hypothetical protein
MMLKCPAVTIVDVAWVKILLPKYVTTLQVFLIIHFMFPYPYLVFFFCYNYSQLFFKHLFPISIFNEGNY